MKKIALSLAVAVSALTVAVPAAAQQRPILVVDTERVLNDCNACKSASATLQGQVAQGRQRAQQLEASLKPEGEALQKAVDALGGKQPDAALKARIDSFRQKQQAGAAELQTKESSIQSTQANVQQQIGRKIVEVVEQSRARRQAAIVVSKQSTLANDSAVDITAEVLAALNQQLPSVSVTPMPQQPKPAGR
jgi:Skp family chaperone for outer membrane proteins